MPRALTRVVRQGPQGVQVKLEQLPDFARVYEKLRSEPKRTAARRGFGRRRGGGRPRGPLPDAAVLGDAWLGPAVADGLLSPVLGAEEEAWWAHVPPALRRVARRAPGSGAVSDYGFVWGVPFRWGCACIAFRRDRVPPERRSAGAWGWGDLWHPGLAGRVGLGESARFLGALTLLRMGASANVEDLADVGLREFAGEFTALRRQVRVASEDSALKALEAGDVWAAALWTGPALAAAVARSPKIELAVPAAGTLLWADLMVSPSRPLGSPPASPLVPLWHDFLLEPARAEPSLGLSRGSASPHLFPPLGDGARGKFIPPDSCLERSDFLEPLSDIALAQLQKVVLAL